MYGNYVGLNVSGTAAIGNTYFGVFASNSSALSIGSGTVGSGNVISGNGGVGLYVSGVTNSAIAGNIIGTDATGTSDINGTGWTMPLSGIVLASGSSGNTIGGTNVSERNIVSGRYNHYGIEIQDPTSINNEIVGNYVGTDVSGMTALDNSGGGVSFWGAGSGNVYRSNLISGNLGVGVLIGNGTTDAEVIDNTIGLAADGSTVLGNSTGILVDDASTDSIVQGNVVSGNNSDGIQVTMSGTTGTTITGKPTLALIPGAAGGAGLSLAQACGLRIAADDAKLTTAFAKVGLAGDYGGSYFLHLVGAAKARELYFTAEVLSGAEAQRMGLVNRAVPAARSGWCWLATCASPPRARSSSIR